MIKLQLIEHREHLREQIGMLTDIVNYEDNDRRIELQGQIRRLSTLIDACRLAGIPQTKNGFIDWLIECVQFANAERHDNRETVVELQQQIRELKDEFRTTERLISVYDQEQA